MVLYRLLKLIAFDLVFYLPLALIAFHVVFYQATVVVNCILDRLSALVSVSCNLANCISPMLTIKYTGDFEIYRGPISATCIYPHSHTHSSHCNHDPCD